MSFKLNLTDVKESSFGLLPSGDYPVVCESAEVKDTKDGTGQYINCKFKTDNGKNVFHMFNFKNKNDKAVEIGLQQLKGFMKCAGCESFKLTDVHFLEGLKAIAVVKIKEDSFGEKNVISYFKPVTKVESSKKESTPFLT